jgi:glycosyltransferase involved in cell wall biosynthesis
MRITCFIDNLGSGGAQRQLCTLALLLRERGQDVTMLDYHKDGFFQSKLQSAGIDCKTLNDRKLTRFYAVRRELRDGYQDVVLAFLPMPSLYSELASFPARRWGLVVSERLAAPGRHFGRRTLHRTADYVATNSHANRLMIEHAIPQLSGRVVTIYNAVDLDLFCPAIDENPGNRPIKIVVVARHARQKNLGGLVDAMAIVKGKRPDLKMEIHWYGDKTRDTSPYDKGLQKIQQNSLAHQFQFYPAATSIHSVYKEADGVGVFSCFEGLSNAACEAMACGQPLLMSNVSDARNLVKHGENGFLFDPASPGEMADAIIEFCQLSHRERRAMGAKSREMAERMFNPYRVADSYMQLLEAAAAHRRIAIQHWVPQIPQITDPFFV